jgi:16S rRNA (guanine(966)-N(2))-methyltransferase RsmD
MRVVGGALKGRRLASFKGSSIRPTSDKVREAVFNLLAARFPAGFESVLDLFAGTGAMGIEAISRGAERVLFVEHDAGAVSVVKKNLTACGIGKAAKILKRSALSALRSFLKSGLGFDLIIIDPPYGSPLAEEVLKNLVRLLNPGGFVVLEASKRTPLTGAPEGLQVVMEKRYGETLVYLLKGAQDGWQHQNT